jgi:hypothetical protein
LVLPVRIGEITSLRLPPSKFWVVSRAVCRIVAKMNGDRRSHFPQLNTRRAMVQPPKFLACAQQKKPGPCGPGLKFASVGAPANHLPEGKKLRARGSQSGRITAPACHAARSLYCKLIPRCTTRQLTCQPCAIGDRPDNLRDGRSSTKGRSAICVCSRRLWQTDAKQSLRTLKISVSSKR